MEVIKKDSIQFFEEWIRKEEVEETFRTDRRE
jgi:hypothetical protein